MLLSFQTEPSPPRSSAGPGEMDLRVPAGPDVEGVRNLSRSFKAATIAIDGFHPRHISELCDSGLSVLSGIFTAMNILGNAPATCDSLLWP
eukprot:6224723-Pyramimonas_sp.AAC.1